MFDAHPVPAAPAPCQQPGRRLCCSTCCVLAGTARSLAPRFPAWGLDPEPSEDNAKIFIELTGLQSSFLATAFQKGAIGTEFLCQLVWELTCGGDQALSLASGGVCSGSPHRGRHHSSSCK